MKDLDVYAHLELDLKWAVVLCALSLVGVVVTVSRWRQKIGWLSVSGFLSSAASALGWFFQAWGLYEIPETRLSTFGGCVVYPMAAITCMAAALVILNLTEDRDKRLH